MVSWWHKRGIAFLKPLPGMSSGVGTAKSVHPRLRARISDLLQPPRINLTASATRMLSHILLMSTGKKGPNPEGTPRTPGKGRFCASPAMWWGSDGDIFDIYPSTSSLGPVAGHRECCLVLVSVSSMDRSTECHHMPTTIFWLGVAVSLS